LGSSTSDLTVQNAIIIDTSTEGILTGGADLLLSALTLSAGEVTSTGGIVSLSGGGQLSGTGKLDVSGSTWGLGGDFVKDNGTLTSSGTLTISQTNLALSGNSTLTSDEALSFVTLNLNNFKLTLGSSTSDLTVENAITIDASGEGILTGGADLSLGALTLSAGDVTSTVGIVSLSGGGQLSGTGKLDVSGSTWVLGEDFVKSSGTLTDNFTNLKLEGHSTLTSDEALSFVNLNLNDFTLTLGSSTSDLTVVDNITIDSSTEGISTGDANLILNASQTISGQGSITSTGGIISLQEGGELSGSGILDVSGSIWTLGGDFEKDGGTLTMSGTNLGLVDNITLTSDEALSFVNLNLNDFKLTLGSSTSDLTVENAITIDASTEGILTGGADLLLSALTLSAGDVTSTGGIVSLSGGGQLSGTGKLDVSGSTWVLGGDFVKSSGTLTISQTNMALSGNSTLTSDEALSFVTLNLNNFKLTLGSSDSDLTVINAITIDASTEGISTGKADLILMSALTMSEGLLESSGGTWVLGGDFNKTSGTLSITETDLTLTNNSTLTSDEALSFVTLKLNGQGLTLNTSSTHLTLSNPFTVGASESVDTQAGSLTLNGSATLEDNGTIESSAGSLTFNGSVALDNASLLLTGGSVALNSGATISGSELKLFDSSLTLAGNVGMTNDSTLSLKNTVINPGSYTIGMTGGTLGLGGTYSGFGAVQTDNATSLELNAATTISSNSAMVIGGLDLNAFALTLGSATTDLTIQSTLAVDNSDSQLITNAADLILPYPLQLSAGSITSTAGTFTLSQGGTINNATLDVRGTTLKLSDNLSAGSGTLTSNNTSVLHLLDDVTLTFNGEKTFKALEHNGKTLTLGSTTSDLKLVDPLTLNAGTLHTQGADLNLQGALTLQNNSLIDSTGGTLTLGGTVDNSSELTVPGTALALRSDFAITGTLSTGTGTTISRNTHEFDLSRGLLKLGGDLNLAGTVTDNDTRLIMQANATLGNSVSTGIGSLDLNGSALSISMAMTINDPLTLDATGEKIVTGAADLTLNGGISVTSGTLSSTGGTLSLPVGATLANGLLDSTGGDWGLGGDFVKSSGTLTISQTDFKLVGHSTLTSDVALSFVTLNLNNFTLTLGSSTSDLTVIKPSPLTQAVRVY